MELSPGGAQVGADRRRDSVERLEHRLAGLEHAVGELTDLVEVLARRIDATNTPSAMPADSRGLSRRAWPAAPLVARQARRSTAG